MQRLAAIKNKIAERSAAKRFFDLIDTEMELVEQEFARQASSNIQIVEQLGEYIRSSGGKRLRPALLLLANRAAGGDASSANVIRLATVMEMLHTATLVHDDIIDHADTRRGRPSVNAKFGNQYAVLIGDWLYMTAFETSLRERSLEILDVLTSLTRKMTEGELIQLTTIADIDIRRDQYFEILRRKTAHLIAGCCEIGALMAGVDEKTRTSMRDYGMNLGVAFQLADDLLDLTSDDRTLGKASGADLLDGKLTLPLIVLAEAEPELREMFRRIIAGGRYADGDQAAIAAASKRHDVVAKVRETAQQFADDARKCLDVLPETEYRVALAELPDFVLDRRS